MKGLFYRLGWFVVIASICAYGIFIVAGTVVFAHASGKDDPVIIRDALGIGVHHYSGMVMVESSCDQLNERIDKVDDTTYKMSFSTWQDPAVACDGAETPRAFTDTLFAPDFGITVIATYNDAPFPIELVAVVPPKTSTP
ncbi:MAG TPA: hypothetical protein VN495_03435 [Candidatus Paceibacterota bacterium]|nr:hypothetical protein [Candidatus Paceibacterota bacterium]